MEETVAVARCSNHERQDTAVFCALQLEPRLELLKSLQESRTLQLKSQLIQWVAFFFQIAKRGLSRYEIDPLFESSRDRIYVVLLQRNKW